MRLKVIVHEADEGGLRAEVPAIPGCATQGETFEELIENIQEAVTGCFDNGPCAGGEGSPGRPCL